jgi:hypothetical protein
LKLSRAMSALCQKQTFRTAVKNAVCVNNLQVIAPGRWRHRSCRQRRVFERRPFWVKGCTECVDHKA